MIKLGSISTLLDGSTVMTAALTNIIEPVNALVRKFDVIFSGLASPEPLTLLVLGSGMAAIGTLARRLRRSAKTPR